MLTLILDRVLCRVRTQRVLLSVFQTAIANATTLAEVERLKGLLQAGQIPGRERKPGHLGHLIPPLLLLPKPSLPPLMAVCAVRREVPWKGQTGS